MEQKSTNVGQFYSGRTIFVTGVTGFVGKVLLQKILRCCSGVTTVFVLVRPKKAQSPEDRLKEIFKEKLFEPLTCEQPEFYKKVVAVLGDITKPRLGISDANLQAITSSVSVIFHLAATVRFDDPLKQSLQMNVSCVRELLKIAKRMEHLDVFVHVSTAYANCDQRHVEEAVYTPKLSPDKLLSSSEWMSDDMFDCIAPDLIRPRPNTYTFTKSLAEYVLHNERGDIPCAIVRPSIVGVTASEPFPGWVDNFNGANGLLTAVGKGMMRIMIGDNDAVADIVPVDICVNLLLAAGWYVGTNQPRDIQIYNCTTGQMNPITWGQVARMTNEHFRVHPLDNAIRTPKIRVTRYKILLYAHIAINHIAPSWVIDLAMSLSGKRPVLYKLQTRITRSILTLEYFTSRQWVFSNDHVMELMRRLSPDDRKIFDFDVRNIEWKSYWLNYCQGIRHYALKEGPFKMTEEKCDSKFKKMRVAKQVVLACVILFLARGFWTKYATSLVAFWLKRLSIRNGLKIVTPV